MYSIQYTFTKLSLNNAIIMDSRVLLLLLVGVVLGDVSPEVAVDVVRWAAYMFSHHYPTKCVTLASCLRCAVQGGLHIPPGGECHEPLTQGPCPDNQVRQWRLWNFLQKMILDSSHGGSNSDGQVREAWPYLLLLVLAVFKSLLLRITSKLSLSQFFLIPLEPKYFVLL